VHAAGESSPGGLQSGTYAVVLSTDSAGLLALEERLKAAGVEHRAIRETGHAYEGQLTAIGICPRPRREVQRYVSSLPLLR
jgi:hypothetical protein